MPLGDRWTPSARYRPVFVPHLMLSWDSDVPPRSEMMFWILRFTVVRTKSTSWLSVEWRHTLRGRMLDHTRTHCGKMLLIEVRSFLTEASRSVGLSVLRSLPPKCMMRTSGLGQVTFSWWSWGRSWGHVMPWVPFHQIATLLGSMPSCIPTSGDLARDSAQYTREWPQIQMFLGSLLIDLPTEFQQKAICESSSLSLFTSQYLGLPISPLTNEYEQNHPQPVCSSFYSNILLTFCCGCAVLYFTQYEVFWRFKKKKKKYPKRD